MQPKSNNIRRQVDVDDDLDSKLRLMAARDKVPVSEFIRRLVSAEWERRNAFEKKREQEI